MTKIRNNTQSTRVLVSWTLGNWNLFGAWPACAKPLRRRQGFGYWNLELIWLLACLREAASAKAGACNLVIAVSTMRLMHRISLILIRWLTSRE